MKKSGLIAGALAGIGLGFLLAPRKGSETREILSAKLDELYKKAKDIDLDDVKNEVQNKINEIKTEIKALDKEKAIDTAKEKATLIKDKIEDLAKVTKDKATPVVESTIEELKKAAVKATKEITNKLESEKKAPTKKTTKK